MKIEFKTGEPPKNGTMIVGLFEKEIIAVCHFGDGKWWLKNYENNPRDDPTLWTLFENFVK
jgi:hypothetical protein